VQPRSLTAPTRLHYECKNYPTLNLPPHDRLFAGDAEALGHRPLSEMQNQPAYVKNAFSHRQNKPWIWSKTFNSFLLRYPEKHDSRMLDIIDKRQSRVGFEISPPAAPRSSRSAPGCRRLASKKSSYSSISIACGTHSRAARRTSS